MDLVYKNEKPLLVIATVISGLVWLALLLGTVGVLLLYLALAYVIFLFAHSAFISHLKGSGVRITEDQYPDLHAKLLKNCEKIGITKVPEAYLLRTDFFNALATRFRGRDFLVLFTDVVDALDDRPGAIDFYIGHELGHIHRKHLSWKTFLMPASVLPLLGSALRRAEEYTCDRYGVACCESEEDTKAALAAIAAGDTRWKTINVDAYLRQADASGGFWMSFNELTGDYPWLTKRMASAIALHRREKIKHPSRHGFAWLLALFVPRVGAGGSIVSVMVVVAVIGVLAAVAIPQYQQYVERARLNTAYSEALTVQQQVDDYAMTNNEWPASLEVLGYPQGGIKNTRQNFEINVYDGGLVAASVGVDKAGEGRFIVLEPQVNENGELTWSCYGENLTPASLPLDCR